MVKRDPNKTARNLMIRAIKEKRRILQPQVFQELADFENGQYCNESSLNAFIGSKSNDYINLKDKVIKSQTEFISLWLTGLKKAVVGVNNNSSDSRHIRMNKLVQGDYPCFKEYLRLFLTGSFLKHYEELYKVRPKIDESEYWFGNNSDEFGLLVTPRYVNGQWENDKSEIRHFKYPYWTLSHVMNTGLCYMGENKTRSFTSLSDYLQFFRDVVRRTSSKYQRDIADRYIDYVNNHNTPLSIPLLIPELRYDPLKKKHQYRLDFLIINPWNLDKYGFEISPWSTHGKLVGRNNSLSSYNEQAKLNFEKEMGKHKLYWRKYGIIYIVYTDADLANIDFVWDEIRRHLEMIEEPEQLELSLMNDFVSLY